MKKSQVVAGTEIDEVRSYGTEEVPIIPTDKLVAEMLRVHPSKITAYHRHIATEKWQSYIRIINEGRPMVEIKV